MQPKLSDGPTQPPLSARMPAKRWLEAEDPDEVRKVEELKKKQKALEKELAEKRKKQMEKKAQTG